MWLRIYFSGLWLYFTQMQHTVYVYLKCNFIFQCDFIFCNVTKSCNCKCIFHDYDFISHNCNTVYHNCNFMFHSVTLFLILNNCDFISPNVTKSWNCDFLMITTLFHTITNHCTSLLYFRGWFISYFKQFSFELWGSKQPSCNLEYHM